jgi:hypothetical protein
MIAMGLLSILLTACGKAPPRESTTALENPPHEPPNCPDLPELKNITLKDGAIADVRIVQFRLRKLYVPTEMMENDLVDKMDRFDDFVPKHKLKRFIPDMHSNECAGIVHKFDKSNSIGSVLFLRKKDSERRLFKNMSEQSSIEMLGIYWTAKPAQDVWIKSNGGTAGVRIYIFDDIEGIYDIPDRHKKDSPEWNNYRSSIIDFVRWLATPPRERDNDRIFTLGAANR